MKKEFVNFSISQVKKYYNYSDEKNEEIIYGLEVLYITITKTIVIFSLVYFLGLFKPFILLFTFYSLLRLTAFGLHAKESWQCWIGSIIIFVLVPYLINALVISKAIKFICSIIGIILIAIYAPSDTEKRPIVNKKKRLIYKCLSLSTASIYCLLMLIIKENLLTNVLFFSVILEVFMILPITYKIFNLSYNNYKNYLANN